eukprot:4066707-Prymnesium_polylepis.1
MGDRQLLSGCASSRDPDGTAPSAAPSRGGVGARSAVFEFLSALKAAQQRHEASDMGHVLCVAPNLVDVPRAFEPLVVLRQVDALGVPPAVALLAAAFPTRYQML